MIKMFKILIFFLLISSTFISISASTWLGAWVGLEVNLMSIIPLFILNKNTRSSEAAIKYFITQIAASLILLTFILLMLMEVPNFFYGLPQPSLGIFMSLMLKMGSAPLHFWLPSVMNGLSWTNCLILMTWQKITPMILTSFVSNIFYLPLLFIILSAIFGALGGLNQTNLKKLMAFSSINHISWMLLALTMNEMLWFVYFIIYSVMSFSIISLFMVHNTSHINQMWSTMNKKMITKLTFCCALLSMGGLPPFLGFLPKWMIISFMVEKEMIMMSIMIMMSLITLFFYIRIAYSTLSLTATSSFNPNETNKYSYLNSTLIFISLSSFLMIPLLSLT